MRLRSGRSGRLASDAEVKGQSTRGGDGMLGLNRGALRTFLLTYACYATIYFARKPFSVVKKSVGEGLMLGTAELGTVDTAFLTMYALGQFTLGPIGDRYGPRLMLAGCFAVASVASLLVAQSSTSSALTVLMGINGFVQAVGFPLCVKALNPWLPGETRGAILGVWTTSQQVGGVLSTTIAGYLAGNFGWRQAIRLPAMVVAVASIAFYFFLAEKKESRSPQTATSKRREMTEGDATSSRRSQGGFFEAVAIPGLLSLGTSYFFVKLARYTLMFWLPFYLSEEHNYPESSAAYLSTLFDIGGVVGSLACGFVSDRFLGGNRLLAVGPLCVCTGVLLLMFPSLAALGIQTQCIMLFLVGFCIAGPDSVLGGAATADACERHGTLHLLTTAGGISNGMGSLGSMVQGPVSSAAVSMHGWPGLFQLLGSLCILGTGAIVPAIIAEYRRFRSGK